jgi:Ni/Co efflux regulator RcnB
MNKLFTILVASVFAVAGANALAADAPKDTSAKTAPAKLEKPAAVTQEAWNKMSDTEKQKAVEKANAAAPKKKEKKGGC